LKSKLRAHSLGYHQSLVRRSKGSSHVLRRGARSLILPIKPMNGYLFLNTFK
jgi:hypothetical protein